MSISEKKRSLTCQYFLLLHVYLEASRDCSKLFIERNVHKPVLNYHHTFNTVMDWGLVLSRVYSASLPVIGWK